MNSFIVGLYRAAESIEELRAEVERRKREWDEAVRRREEAERRRQSEERRRANELARLNSLKGEAAGWEEAERIRAYLAAVRSRMQLGGGIEPGGDLERWLTWAVARADELDPMTRRCPRDN